MLLFCHNVLDKNLIKEFKLGLYQLEEKL